MNLSGIILAGGKSSRMGVDKSKLQFMGKTFLENSIQLTSKVCNEVIVVSNSNPTVPDQVTVVSDKIKDHGPMMGLLSGLEVAKNETCLVLSVDSPTIQIHDLNQLITNYEDQSEIVIYSGRKLHPFPGLYRKRLIARVEKLLLEGQNRMTTLIEECKSTAIQISEDRESNLKNINTPEEYQKLIHA